MKSHRKRDPRIPRKPLLWLAASLVFTLPPMFGNLAPWVPGAFLFALVAKFLMEPKGYRLRSVPIKLLLAAVAFAGIFGTYGTVKGIEPGVSLIALLMSIKILEAHTAREFQIMVLIGFVLCLCGFFLSQDLIIALSILFAFVLLLVALVQFHRGPSSTFWPPVRVALTLLVQSVPLIALLFVFFPRISTGFRLQIGSSQNAAAGFSGQLSPGSVSSLANSSGIAFRAEFPEGNIPTLGAMYWRGVVMWRCESGLEWQASEAPAALPRTNRAEAAGNSIHQAITIEPHHSHWLFALDWPASSPPGSILAPGNYLWNWQPLNRQRRYEVVSYSEIRDKGLGERERKLMLHVRQPPSPQLWSLVQPWRAKNANPRAVVNEVLQFFKTQGFQYSLSPGEYKKGDIDEFLFQRRLGFCEHYAAAFATLMRLSGVPARVVTGYLGGEYNELGQFFLVRQADAHAWCEVWLPGTGWERVDPTAVVAPDRVNLGLSAFLERRAIAGQVAGQNAGLGPKLARWPLFARARLAWQTLNYEWDTRVVSFDSDAQEAFMANIGLTDFGFSARIMGVVGAVIGLVGFYIWWMVLRTSARGDKLRELYETFCRKAARLGATRSPAEGPFDFCRRAAQLLPNESARIQWIIGNYIALRYADEKDPRLLADLARQIVLFGRS